MGVDHDEACGVRRVYESETRAKHTAHGVAHDGQSLNAEGLQEPVGVQGELLQAELVYSGLGGFAEADLVGDNDAVAGNGEDVCGLVPRRATEVLAVQEHDDIAIGAGGLDIHIRHFEFLILRLEMVDVDRIGICKIRPVQTIFIGMGICHAR